MVINTRNRLAWMTIIVLVAMLAGGHCVSAESASEEIVPSSGMVGAGPPFPPPCGADFPWYGEGEADPCSYRPPCGADFPWHGVAQVDVSSYRPPCGADFLKYPVAEEVGSSYRPPCGGDFPWFAASAGSPLSRA